MSADMRYLDQILEVNVPVPDLSQEDSVVLEQWSANLHQRYQELYSYQQSDQEIRLVTLRVSVFGALPSVNLPSRGRGQDGGCSEGERTVYLGGGQKSQSTIWTSLPAQWEMEGPAIVESDFTTILVQAGTGHRRTGTAGCGCRWR